MSNKNNDYGFIFLTFIENILLTSIVALVIYWMVLSFMSDTLPVLSNISAAPALFFIGLTLWARKSKKGAITLLVTGLLLLVLVFNIEEGAKLVSYTKYAGPILAVLYGTVQIFKPVHTFQPTGKKTNFRNKY